MAKETGKAIVKWDEELAKLAAESAEQEANTGGGSFISTRGGVLQVDGAPVPGNVIGSVVVDSILVNAKYDGDYDDQNRQSPMCYAFGRDEKTMKPHPKAPKPQSEDCASCEHNQWGTAEKGRGKACKNGRRVAVVPAGTFEGEKFKPFNDPKHFATTQRFYLSVPPTSINGYGTFVKQLAGALKVPPFAVFTKIALVRDPKSQFKVTFEPITRAPADLIPVLFERHRQEKAVIEFPWPDADETTAKKPVGKKGSRY